MVAIVDYGAGNLTSVKLAFAALGVETVPTSDPETIARAERIVFPGVGAAGSAMANLERLGLRPALTDAIARQVPFLGICLGMQILFDHTEEDGGVDLLGFIPGKVRRFKPQPGCKIPEMGWNQVNGGAEYYFVHSYYAELNPFTIGRTEFAGVTFSSAVRKGSIVATQFHPEKSGRVGLEFLKRFLSWQGGEYAC